MGSLFGLLLGYFWATFGALFWAFSGTQEGGGVWVAGWREKEAALAKKVTALGRKMPLFYSFFKQLAALRK